MFHILVDRNTEAVNAISAYIQTLRTKGFTDLKGAIHGGNFVGSKEKEANRLEADTIAGLKASFLTNNVTLEIDEAGENRGDKSTALGAIIEEEPSGDVSIRFFDKVFASRSLY